MKSSHHPYTIINRSPFSAFAGESKPQQRQQQSPSPLHHHQNTLRHYWQCDQHLLVTTPSAGSDTKNNKTHKEEETSLVHRNVTPPPSSAHSVLYPTVEEQRLLFKNEPSDQRFASLFARHTSPSPTRARSASSSPPPGAAATSSRSSSPPHLSPPAQQQQRALSSARSSTPTTSSAPPPVLLAQIMCQQHFDREVTFHLPREEELHRQHDIINAEHYEFEQRILKLFHARIPVVEARAQRNRLLREIHNEEEEHRKMCEEQNRRVLNDEEEERERRLDEEFRRFEEEERVKEFRRQLSDGVLNDFFPLRTEVIQDEIRIRTKLLGLFYAVVEQFRVQKRRSANGGDDEDAREIRRRQRYQQPHPSSAKSSSSSPLRHPQQEQQERKNTTNQNKQRGNNEDANYIHRRSANGDEDDSFLFPSSSSLSSARSGKSVVMKREDKSILPQRVEAWDYREHILKQQRVQRDVICFEELSVRKQLSWAFRSWFEKRSRSMENTVWCREQQEQRERERKEFARMKMLERQEEDGDRRNGRDEL